MLRAWLKKFNSHWLAALLIFALALFLRLPGLGSFITTDEPNWMDWSRGFVAGLLMPDFECDPIPQTGRTTPVYGLDCTIRTGHPAVTTMWSGGLGMLVYYWSVVRPTGLGLTTFLQTPLTAPLDPLLVLWMRLPVVILSSAFIAVFYLLLRRLLTGRIAFLAAILLVTQPLHIALSRVLHHDALNTTFMLLSILPLLGYWRLGWSRGWLVFSGVMAGLAVLTKTVSWLLLPYVALIGVLSLFYRSPRLLWRLLGEGALWGGITVLTIVVFCPALWSAPGEALAVMFNKGIQMADEGHTHYFLGQVSDDPGFWFYPLAWLWQATPLEIIGLILLPVVSSRIWSLKRLASRPVEVALLLFLVLLFVLETVTPKKMLRYFLPAFPVLAVFAAYGLLGLADRVARFLKMRTGWIMPGLTGLIILLHGGLALSHFPYYFTYYNPLLGGPTTAARLMTVGWGEGIEQAAAYLNRLPNAETLTVSSWYNDIFQLYFVGKRASFADDGRAQLAADYVVFYVNQIQRQKPYPGLVDYFRAGKPVFVVNVGPWGWDTDLSNTNSVRWVEVYKAPAAQSASGAPKIEGVARLLAYKVAGSRVAGNKTLNNTPTSLSANEIAVTLFLRVLGPLPEGTTLGVALADGQRWSQWKFTGVKGEWREGNIVEWTGKLTLPADLPPGEYRLWAALQFADGTVIAEFPIADKDPRLQITQPNNER